MGATRTVRSRPISETTWPSSTRIRRGQRSATACSCVMTTIVAPCRLSSSIRAMICSPVALSRFPVGSSASTIAGAPTRARAIATRCRSPPESWVGRARSHTGVEHPVGDILANRGVLGQEELLKDEPDLPGTQSRQLAVAQPRRVDPADADHAAARPLQRPNNVQQRGLARPGGPHDRHQLAPPDGEGHPPQGEHRGLLTVDLGDFLQLQYRVTHIEGTTTESPARRSPSTWTRPPPVSNRPSFTATSSRRSPARTTSTANPPPDLPTSAVTGTLRARSTPLVVMSTWTGAWSSPPALAGSSRLMKVGMVASAA